MNVEMPTLTGYSKEVKRSIETHHKMFDNQPDDVKEIKSMLSSMFYTAYLAYTTPKEEASATPNQRVLLPGPSAYKVLAQYDYVKTLPGIKGKSEEEVFKNIQEWSDRFAANGWTLHLPPYDDHEGHHHTKTAAGMILDMREMVRKATAQQEEIRQPGGNDPSRRSSYRDVNLPRQIAARLMAVCAHPTNDAHNSAGHLISDRHL